MRLRDVDLGRTIGKQAYASVASTLHRQLVQLQGQMVANRVPTLLVFEGWDASGKGGTIRRLLKHLDPRHWRLHPIAKPTEEELAHHYLWRFWTRLPQRGELVVFDRSWYGRVLVERIEGFASEREWRRAYDEINAFERQLGEDGTAIVKFFMHIGKEEQKQRFSARERDPLKSWKMNDEDYRNRKKWDRYELAIDDMLARTSTPHAPWHVVAANDKRWARIDVMRTCVRAFETRLAR